MFLLVIPALAYYTPDIPEKRSIQMGISSGTPGKNKNYLYSFQFDKNFEKSTFLNLGTILF